MNAPNTSRSPSPETQPPVALRGAELVAAIGASPELFEEARDGLLRVAAAIHGQRDRGREFGEVLPEMAVHFEESDEPVLDFGSWERAWDEARSEAFGG